MSNKLKIDPEFKSRIPDLSPEEYEGLKKNLIEEGCRDAIVTWDDIILDGHNRYEICQEYEIRFKTITKSFESREDAMDWIDANQLSRRNLTPEQASLIRGRRYNRAKKAQGGNHKSKDQNDTLINQADLLAKEHGVSAPTIKRDGQFADAVEKIKPHVTDIEKRVMTGNIPSKKAVIEAAKDPGEAVENLNPQKKKDKSKKANRKSKGATKGAKDDEDSDALLTLKKYWKSATKKDKQKFFIWIKSEQK